MLLVNAQHIKAVPGRKMDAKDSERIARTLAAWFALSDSIKSVAPLAP